MRIFHNIIDRFRKKKVIDLAVKRMMYDNFDYVGDYLVYHDIVYFVSIREKFVRRANYFYE